MKRMIKTIATSLLTGMILTPMTYAAGTSAAQFLKMGAGTRAEGMGNAYSAVANDVTAGYWNPAGLAQLENPEIAAMQNSHFIDTQYQYLAGAMPIGKSVFGLSLYRLDYGSIDGYSATDVKTGSFDAGSLATSLSIGHKMSEEWMVGASLKYVSESIENESASTFAADLGTLYKMGQYNLSAVIQHLGPGMKFVNESSPLPMTVRLGASTKVLNEKMLLAAEISKPNDAEASFHLGTEYRVVSMVALRAGYSVTPGQDSDLGGLVGLNGGLGITFNRFNLDYSVSPFGDLGISQRFSLGYKFGSSK